MSQIVNSCVTGLNSVGDSFCHYAAGMFLQTGVLVAVLLIIDCLLRRRVRATLRYWIWMLVFIKLLLPPSLSVPTGVGYWLGGYVSLPPAVSVSVSEPVTETVTRHEPLRTPVHGETRPRAETRAMRQSGPVPAVTAPVASTPVRLERLGWRAAVFMLWSAGVLIFAALVIQRWLFVKRLIARGQGAPDGLVEVLDQCRLYMGVRQKVGLRLSPKTFSPAVCGLLRPTVLIPAALLERLSPDNLRAVLIHELAHVRRGDLWVNSLQTVLQIIYFYNPLVWLANTVVRRVREQAVDEMVLVALGAEARSYSRMLIDMAEMAFLRVSPALRLVGVAESRKSLEGRIRHMITRPIPNSARIGIVGALIVAATGAILLPMAAAGTKATPQRFTANLPNGVTVELVGVCNWPTGEPVCWKADGSPLDKPLHVTKWNQRPGAHHYGFMLRIAGPNDLDRSWNRIEGSDGWEASCDVVDAQGNRLDGHTAAVALLKQGATQTSLRLGFATGPWSTISSHDGKGMSTGRHTGVLWSQMFGDSGGTSVVATAEWRKDRTERIVAIDTEGVMHAPPSGSVAQGNMDQMTTRFPGLKPAQIKEFQYQVRPYEWVEFRNVSLRPGHETAVTVQTEASQAEVNRPQTSSTVPRDEAQARLQSARRLEALAKAMLIYANDHDDRLPDGIESLRDELKSADMEWLRRNVAYLGKGLPAHGEPSRVVAYDKTMLGEGGGTNVLYLDAHVIFESPQRLRELGIVQAAAAQEGSVGPMDYDSVTVRPGIGFDDIVVGDSDSTMEQVKAKLGPPDREEERWLGYGDKYGLDFWFSPSDVLMEIRMNPGFRGRLASGISLASSQADVFRQYGRPVEERNVDDLHRRNEDRVLFRRGDVSRIYYADEGLIFWFKGDRISQIVTFPKMPTAGEQTPDTEAELSATKSLSDSLANIFILSPSRSGFDAFDAVLAKAGERTWNKTGRNHAKKSYDEIFDGTHNRAGHDVLVLVFALDLEDRIPAEYEDLLPQPWSRIQGQLQRGQTVELSRQARDLHVILLAAPRAEQLPQVIAGSRFLGNPGALLGRSGKGCDVAIQGLSVQQDQDRGTFRARVSIRNIGGAASPKFIVSFYRGDPATSRPMIHGAGPLKPGQTWNESSSDFGLKEGDNEVHVALDPADLVEELDETNNRAALRVVVRDGQIVEQSAVPTVVEGDELGEAFRVYEVNRSVADFPPAEDFSTPEAAYATINRIDRGDPSAWQRVSVARMAARLARQDSGEKPSVDPEWTKVLLNARICEVMVWNMTRAAVMAELPQGLSSKPIVEPIDVRFLELENGRWLNTGNGRFRSIEAAKTHFMDWMEREIASAEAMRDPLQHAGEIKDAAAQLFERLRTADYADILSHYRDGEWEPDAWKKFPTQGLYMVHTDYPGFVLWCCTHFKDNPIIDVQLGDVFIGDALVLDKTGWPTVPYKLTLKDGTVLAGNLPFSYEVNRGRGHWHGMEGIDWHLWGGRAG